MHNFSFFDQKTELFTVEDFRRFAFLLFILCETCFFLLLLLFFFFLIIYTEYIGDEERGNGKTKLTILVLTKGPNLCKY